MKTPGRSQSVTGGQDTIAALATPPGRGAISIVRISGPRALAMLEHDNVCDPREMRRTHAAFGIEPRPFADTV